MKTAYLMHCEYGLETFACSYPTVNIKERHKNSDAVRSVGLTDGAGAERRPKGQCGVAVDDSRPVLGRPTRHFIDDEATARVPD